MTYSRFAETSSADSQRVTVAAMQRSEAVEDPGNLILLPSGLRTLQCLWRTTARLTAFTRTLPDRWKAKIVINTVSNADEPT
jgi:hypothetical protein